MNAIFKLQHRNCGRLHREIADAGMLAGDREFMAADRNPKAKCPQIGKSAVIGPCLPERKR